MQLEDKRDTERFQIEDLVVNLADGSNIFTGLTADISMDGVGLKDFPIDARFANEEVQQTADNHKNQATLPH